MVKFNVQLCPVCDESNFSTFLTCTDFFVSKEKFKIKECDSCGFKITDDVADEDEIGSYYQSEEYISHSNTAKGLVNAIYHFVRKIMLQRKRRLVEKNAGMLKGQLLDIGAGTGYFLNEMQQYGWRVTGTEKSCEARGFAKKEFDLNINETHELFQFEDKSFDVITLWHVLEHIHRLDENMKTFHRLLKNHGRLVVAVPNHDSYDARHYKEFWAAYDVPRHIWHFSPEQMNRFGEKHKLKLVKMRPMPFDSFYVSILSERYKKSGMALLKGLFHGKISWLNSLFYAGKCSSVIYVFEKLN